MWKTGKENAGDHISSSFYNVLERLTSYDRLIFYHTIPTFNYPKKEAF